MDNKAVFFKEIEIHNALGITPGDGFELSEISPGVNLIFGPNGSGKSTTALVIQELLWPGKTGIPKPTVSARFSVSDLVWSVKIDAGHTETENMQHSGSTPNIGPVENRSRYLLALHELINSENTDFARVITAESQGGFDLDAAKEKLKFSTPTRKPSKVLKKARDAHDKVKEARAVQERIARKEQLLPDLRRKRQKASDAERKISILNQAEEFQSAANQCTVISDQIALYPDEIALLSGSEEQNLQKLADKQKDLEKKINAARQNQSLSNRTLAKLNLPDELIQDDTLAVVRGLQKNLLSREKAIDEQTRISLYSQSETDTAKDRIGPNLSLEQLSAFDTVIIEDMSMLARQSDLFHGEEIALAEKKRLLSGVESENLPDYRSEQIRDGIASLKQWLKTPDPAEKKQPTSRIPFITAASILVLLAVVLGLIYTPEWFLLILPAVLLFIWEIPKRIDKENKNEKSIHASSYRKTMLPAPTSWENGSVIDLLESLVDLAEAKAQENRLALILRDLAKDEQTLENRKTELDQQRKQIEEKMGFTVAMDIQWLPLLVQNIGRWQKHSAALSASKNVLLSLESEKQLLLKTLTEKMIHFGYSEILSAEQADQATQDLSKRLEEYHSSVQMRETTDVTITEVQLEIESIQSERLAIFAKVGLDPTQTSTLEEWSRQLPDFLLLQKELTKKEAIRKNRQERLAGNEELLNLDPEEISVQIRELEEEADKRDDITEKITVISRSIETAQAGHILSDALSLEDQALSDLADLKEQHSVSIAGDLLIDWIREVAIDRARPLVFKRACELVSEFTNGHLKLIIDDRSNPPQFKATVNGSHARPVPELSTGERVQLLIAIRAAFLEQNEPVRLPLLLDEALGTSDDLRAGLIIEAVVKIAESGRQVFYFTAQHDEIAKWVTKLTSTGTPYTLIDLGDLRKLQVATFLPLEVTHSQPVTILSPAGMTHEEYGRALKVGNINPHADNQDRLHLWHLISDDILLQQFLTYKIEEWGQLKTLIEHGGEKLVNAEPEEIEKIYTAARAVEAACAGWRVGRGKTVNRRVLQDSGCVSESFMESVSDLSNSLNGSAAGIILGLKNRVIPRWLTTKTDELQNYLENNGYLSPDSVLSSQEIRIRVLASVAEAVSKQLIDASLIERIVGSLPL